MEYKELKLASSDDKVHRTEVHKAFRTHFEGFLDTKTEEDRVVVMVVGRADRRGRPAGGTRSGGRSDAGNQRQRQWPACWGDYLRFVLYKENKDTTAAVSLLAKFTNTRPNRFTYAGTKDKRGVTTQHMTIYRMRAEQLRGLNAKLYGMRAGNFSYVPQPLRLGDLFGNRFSIILREVSASEEVINEALTELKRTGFINYYGLQRFGTSSVATHRVGVALLQGRWQEATSLILQPRQGEEKDCDSARRYYLETGDIAGTLRKMPRQLHVERLLLQGLNKMGKTQHLVAFQTLPRNLRMLYPHSYQSFVWNRMATERVRRYGADKPVVGDIVLLDTKENDVAEPMDEVAAVEDKPAAEEEPVAAGEEEEEEKAAEEAANSAKFNVKVLTEADLPNFTIDDVVLPLPGYQVKYPENEVGAAYVRVLAEQGLTVDSFNSKVRDFRLPGGYRRLLARPIDLEWDFSYFDDPSDDLLQTDLDKLEGKAPRPALSTGRYRAVRVSFTLGSSSYATMLLREMMKQESSIDVQKRLYAAQRERHTAASSGQ